MTFPKVVIIILNYVNWKDTSECLRSLENCTYPNFEILLIDNCSPNDSFSKLSELFPSIRIIVTQTNLGYTGGINFGITEALKKQTEYIFVLNSDTIVEKNFLSEIVTGIEQYPNVVAACSLILEERNRNKIWYAGGSLVKWRGLAVHHLQGKSKQLLKSNKPQRVSFITGCSILFRAGAFSKIGLEDDRFFMYLDDIEYSARILKKGYDLLFVPTSIIYHRVEGKEESAFKLYYSVRNRLLFIHTALTGLIRWYASIYFFCVISYKLVKWSMFHRKYFRAAVFGLQDYFNNNFYEGRGHTLFYVPEDLVV